MVKQCCFKARCLSRGVASLIFGVDGIFALILSAEAATDYQSADYDHGSHRIKRPMCSGAVGAAFLDHNQSGRKTTSGTITLDSEDDDQISPIITFGHRLAYPPLFCL